jgi:hypothetical protein
MRQGEEGLSLLRLPAVYTKQKGQKDYLFLPCRLAIRLALESLLSVALSSNRISRL